MIIRPHQHWFFRLFDWHGSVLSKIKNRLFLNVAMSCVALICLDWYETLGIKLTLAPFSLLGIAIAIFLGFRNSVSYARFNEARLLWGNLMIQQRTLLRQVKTYTQASDEELRPFVNLQIAFPLLLKDQLRKNAPSSDIGALLPADLWESLRRDPFPCNQILFLMGKWLERYRQRGDVSDILFQSMDQTLSRLASIQGGCERIASTPVPFAYSLIVHRTVYLFCTLLPLALVPDLHYMTILVSVFISYTFISLDALAEELEEPFGTAANDLPLNSLCNDIQINLLSMLGERNLPPRHQPNRHFRLD
ncbi:hypothetical protein FJU30_18275 [Affinibrenneria salicis]|uniref:Bestrophin n=1 Tax=Affinibrenneria salicis TaxID=2590031 RepID=A0A5J5FW39_9GAMM|nr:bestrophin family ion channel [Affinibrenneria salicis]KAA8997705.1 hypothetical protein FJU30_18275 [Affinibrenneria salicis]